MSMDKAELLALAERIERLTGPNYAVEVEIFKAMHPEYAGYVQGRGGLVHPFDGSDQQVLSDVRPSSYTASLYAAMTLVPEGWSVGGHIPGVVRIGGKWLCRAHLRDHRPGSLTEGGHSHIYVEGHHTELPIAIAIAALRAHASAMEGEG